MTKFVRKCHILVTVHIWHDDGHGDIELLFVESNRNIHVMMTSSTSSNLSLCVPRPSSAEARPRNSLKSVLVKSDIPKTDQENFVLIRVDRFGFSANNITYQALGEAPHFRCNLATFEITGY